MKKLAIIFILILSLSSSIADAQHYLGVTGGYGGGGARFYPKIDGTEKVWGLYTGGLSYKWLFEPNYIGGLQADVLLLQQGYRNPTDGGTDTTRMYERTINSVMVPLFWQPHINMFGGRMRTFVNLGVTLSYNINSDYSINSEITGVVSEGEYEMMVVRDNRWGYGLCGGAGFNVAMGHFETAVEVRYYFGYSDILKNTNKYEYNPLRSPLDDMNIALSLYYKFGESKVRTPKLRVKREKIVEDPVNVEK